MKPQNGGRPGTLTTARLGSQTQLPWTMSVVQVKPHAAGGRLRFEQLPASVVPAMLSAMMAPRTIPRKRLDMLSSS